MIDALRKKFPLGAYLWTLVAILVLGTWPLIAFALSIPTVSIFGCTRGIVSYTCSTGGIGVVTAIDYMELSFWLIVFTFPIGLLLFSIWLGIIVVHVMNYAGRSKKVPAP